MLKGLNAYHSTQTEPHESTVTNHRGAWIFYHKSMLPIKRREQTKWIFTPKSPTA